MGIDLNGCWNLSLVVDGEKISRCICTSDLFDQLQRALTKQAPVNFCPRLLRCAALAQSCVLFLLLRLFQGCYCVSGDDRAVSAAKDAALELMDTKVLPRMPLLLRSFDPAIADATTGNNAMHQMCSTRQSARLALQAHRAGPGARSQRA